MFPGILLVAVVKQHDVCLQVRLLSICVCRYCDNNILDHCGLLRKVQPELMEAVIQATKDGDMDRFQALPSKVSEPIREDLESDGEESEEEEMDEEVLLQYAEVAKRWSEGLISGDASITREVYSIYNIDFDRQELRKLVREVHARQDSEMIEETSSRTEASEALDQARKSLDNFLTELAKQSSINAY
eukprot:Gb_40938 [translate_table: standard]